MRALKTIFTSLALLVLASVAGFAQSVPVKYLSTSGTNATLVGAGNYSLKAGIVVNTTGTVYYLKLYNKATIPSCGTDIPAWTVPIPISTNGPVVLDGGLIFPAGLGFCITGGIADSDTSSAAAGIVVNLGVSRQALVPAK